MKRISLVVLVLVMALAACGLVPTATPVPPTATPVPPTATPVPPTATPVPPTATPVPPTATPVPPTATPASLSTSEVVDLLRPSTVLIYAQFAGDQRSTGTGIVYTEEGLCVTNAHVVEGAVIIKVQVPGTNRWLSAKTLGISPCDDLAVIDIAGSGFTPATLGDSDSLKLGDELLALGYPLAADLGTDLTVTRGIVSKLHAQLDQLEDLIQTDASINPGNSGGPLVNMKGEVVGINTVKVEYTDSGRPVQGLNFAIGASFGRPLVDELAQGENVHWIGINAIPNTAEIADYFGLPTSDGLLVYASASGSPADKTGFEPGDVLVEVEGVTVNSQAALCDILKSHHPDDVLAVAVVRGDTLLTGQIRGTPFKPTKVSSPATEGAIIGTITFAEDVTDNDTPIKPGAFFDYGITAVYGIFQYSGIPRGAEFEYVWLRDGETDVTDGEAWDSEPAGSFWVSIYNDEGLTPGKYELLLHVEGELLQSGGFVVGDESRAGAFGRYANSRLGFSLQYPVDWEVVDDGDVIYFSDPDTSLLAFVGVIELDGPLTPAAMAEQFMEGVGEETPGLEIEDGGEGTIAGVPAAWSTATFEDEGKEMSILVISAVRDDLGYNLGVIAATDDLDESGDAFTDVILESFRFLE